MLAPFSTLSTALRGPWSAMPTRSRCSVVTARTGFYDQPHLSRHVKRILGVSPKAFAAGDVRARETRAGVRCHILRR